MKKIIVSCVFSLACFAVEAQTTGSGSSQGNQQTGTHNSTQQTDKNVKKGSGNEQKTNYLDQNTGKGNTSTNKKGNAKKGKADNNKSKTNGTKNPKTSQPIDPDNPNKNTDLKDHGDNSGAQPKDQSGKDSNKVGATPK